MSTQGVKYKTHLFVSTSDQLCFMHIFLIVCEALSLSGQAAQAWSKIAENSSLAGI